MTDFFGSIALLACQLIAQASISEPLAPDPWKALSFLAGTWTASTQAGSAGAKSSGTYTFQTELNHHVLARHTLTRAGCSGPANYDCEHGDLLYIYQEPESSVLKAIYFDNEGHVIHYVVSSPAPESVVLLSENSQPGPQFRLTYTLKLGIMTGSFEMRMPGQTDWKSYLKWSGRKQ